MKIESKVEISKPPSEVYQFLLDEENLTLWKENFIKIEHLSGEEGEVGARSRHVYNENGRNVAFIEEITAADQGQLFQSILRNDKMEITITDSLTPIDNDRTLLEVSSELRPQNILSQIITFFFL